MVTDVLRVQGSYNVQAQNGSITLDSPSTVLTGNLTVLGTQTNVDSVNVIVTGTVLVLNQGEPGPVSGSGITRTTPNFPQQTSGLMVARGHSDSTQYGAFLLYDDSVTITNASRAVTTSTTGMWRFAGQNYYPGNEFGSAIEVQAIRTPNQIALNLLGAENPHAILTVKGTINYASNVLDNDDIPNKQYVDNQLAVGTTLTQKILVGNSFIEILDNSVSTVSQYFSTTNQIIGALGTSTNIVLKIEDGSAQFQNLTFVNSTIRVTSTGTETNTNIELTPAGMGVVQMDSGFSILQTPMIPTSTNYTNFYSSSTVGGGGTGVYFVNTNGADELVSRKKAIVYGIIF